MACSSLYRKALHAAWTHTTCTLLKQMLVQVLGLDASLHSTILCINFLRRRIFPPCPCIISVVVICLARGQLHISLFESCKGHNVPYLILYSCTYQQSANLHYLSSFQDVLQQQLCQQKLHGIHQHLFNLPPNAAAKHLFACSEITAVYTTDEKGLEDFQSLE